MARAYFSHLNYSLGDEDSSVELHALPADARHVVAVAGSGGRVVPLLARAPRKLTCVDISDTQLALTELRIAALRQLNHAEYLGLLGYEAMSIQRRLELLATLPLSGPARTALDPVWKAVQAGERIVYLGRFEGMLRTLSRFVGLFTGQRGRRMFDQPDVAGQRTYLDGGFPKGAWKLVLLLMGNSAVLNSLLYRGDFPKKNLPGSAFRIYWDIFDRLFRTLPVRSSFFLQLVFFGELRYPEGYPIECDADVFLAAQRAARDTDIEYVRGDIIQHVQEQRGVDFVSLSDVPSFLPPERERDFLNAMKPGLAPDALVVTRGHLRVAAPEVQGYEVVSNRYQDAIAQERTQLWRIHLYQRRS
ncbi:DUF3419 family protein [Corallococcus caeni]|uniref:DUF3419 family protein n=1 Tax=Corallococcus caeni TaxID=3082388 RepID=A0ABQ6QQV6_9BACT|nr:hypothetical protein ASNO1_24700 [Corallococcus sp. NO1]